jgi:glycosyltransferase involved in cell wall biosynthesis
MAVGRLHVALNAHLLYGGATYRSAGIHHYIANLLRHLPEVDARFRYTVFAGPGQADGVMPGAVVHRSSLPTARPLARVVWEQVLQPVELLRVRPDLLHSLAFVSPLLAATPSVVTVYDLSFSLAPERLPRARRLYLGLLTGLSCRRARRVIAISESTRADVVRHYGVPAARVDVAYPGVDERFRPLPPAEVEAFRARRGLPERFILYLGTLEPRKNLEALVRAFARLRPAHPGLKLVLAGARGWWHEMLFGLVRQLGLEADCLFPGYVTAEELPLWYNACAAFAYPSTYEGFGMPVVEALACARPVVTSDVSSLPEAGGQAALRVNPNDVEALADALARALELPPDHLARGPAHAARFTWTRTAAAVAASYRRALGDES